MYLRCQQLGRGIQAQEDQGKGGIFWQLHRDALTTSHQTQC